MSMMQQINSSLTEFIIGLIIGIGLLGAAWYYLVKVHKIKSIKEKYNYSTFRREDSMVYVPFDDIVYRDGNKEGDLFRGMGMIVENKNRFTAGIEIYGNGFYNLEGKGQAKIITAMVAFIKTIKDKDKVQFSGTSRRIDETEKINLYKERAKQVAKELLGMDEDKRELIELARENLGDDKRYNLLIEELDNINKLHYVKENDLQEINAMIEYLEQISSNGNGIDPERTMFFSYEYDEDSFTEKMTKEEIYLTAYENLAAQASAYCDALAAVSCYATPLSAGRLFDAFRKHYHPVTSKKVSIKEWIGKTGLGLFISCDSLIEQYIEINGEEKWNRELEEYQRKYKEMLQKQKKDMETSIKEIEDEMQRKANEV